MSDDDVTARLVEALRRANRAAVRAETRDIVALLLPVVRELIAEELEAAADDVRSIQGTGRPYDMADRVWRRLRARVQALRAGR